MENDGSVLASSITCAGLAIINASIHVFDVIIGTSMVSLVVVLFVVVAHYSVENEHVYDTACDEEVLGVILVTLAATMKWVS